MENEIKVENTVATPVTNESNNVNEPVSQGAVNPTERAYTRDEVTALMKKRVERSHNSFFKRYGVNDLKGLDELFEQSKKFKQMQDEYGAIQLKNSELVQQNAFLRNNINPDKYADILAYFKGSDIPFSEEALLEAIANHSEWLKPSNVPATTTIKTLGSEAHTQPTVDESVRAGKLFGVKF